MKTFGSIVLGFLMTIFIFIISLFACVRIFLSSQYMTRFVEVMFEEEGGVVALFSEEFPELAKYLDEDEVNKEFGKFFSDFLKYTLGVPNQKLPTLSGMKKLLDKAIAEYIKDTGKEFDYDTYNEQYERVEASIETELIPETEKAPEEVSMIFKIIYSDTIMLILVLLIAISLLIDYLIRKDLLIVLRHTGIVSLINAFSFGSLGLFILSVETDDVGPANKIIDLIGQVPCIISVLCIVLGIVFIVLSIVLKKKRNIINNGLGYYAEAPSTGPVTVSYN